MLCVGSKKALVIAGNATFTEKSRGTRETPSPITKTAKLFNSFVPIFTPGLNH